MINLNIPMLWIKWEWILWEIEVRKINYLSSWKLIFFSFFFYYYLYVVTIFYVDSSECCGTKGVNARVANDKINAT